MKPIIIYEDNHLIAVNKRGGELSQKDKTNDDSLIEKVKAYLKIKYNKPGEVYLGSIHRLDRPTSGVIIYARTSKALTRMNDIFKKRNLTKKYLALVNRKPPEIKAKLEHYLEKNHIKNKSFVTHSKNTNAKKAELEYEVLSEVNGAFVLSVNLLTGRHHQIRCQLAAIGCPIIGDLKYGHQKANSDKSICLHCSELSFTHPVKKELLLIRAKVPDIPEWRDVG
ncbi:RluA family pseudouridine synthase [Portibacter marinus]|uniref:RluA family pseudouridine synthase n=1 Tax=Portibacter marinus TaxID=2898660 RepID=UPI001F2B2EF5|nr:RNA pseudouridine synthase [Portibacter marinus]